MKTLKPLLFSLLLVFSLIPQISLASEEIFTGTVERIGDENITVRHEDTDEFVVIERNIEISGLQDLSVFDKVKVSALETESGETQYFIIGLVRTWPIIGICILFVLSIFWLFGKKGFASLLTLLLLFASLFFVIIPLILRGFEPIFTTSVVGGTAVLLSLIVFHGFQRKTIVTIFCLFLSLLLTGALAWLFASWASLTGFSSDEATILQALGYDGLNIRGILIASMIIGALGVLDDAVIAQVSSTQEIQQANPHISEKELYKATLRIGKDHSAAVINTLALAYAGSAFTLLMLIAIGQPPFDTLNSIINNELVATELVRLLSGTIGIILSLPLVSWIAARMYTSQS